MGIRSNLARLFLIRQLKAKASDGGGGTHRNSLFRDGAARSSPDFAVFGHPEVKTAGIWVREDLHGMRDALVT